ncbi:MAG: hypothetical protein ACXWIU_01475 [Limisphaerales bacterium]
MTRALLCLLCVLMALTASARTILFLDDKDVLYRSGTKRVLVPLKAHAANPLLKGHEKPWETAIAWTSVYRNPANGHYQLWYQAFAGDAARDKTRRCTVCYASSDDGIHFTRPNLGLYDFNGIKENNIVLLANGGRSDRYGVSVVMDEKERDANRRYKMAYFDFTRDDGKELPGLNVAFSADGIHWTKYPHGPLSRASYGDYGEPVPFAGESNGASLAWPLSMADALDVFWDTPRSVFAIYGKMWIDGPDGGMHWKHAMGRIESSDFIHWSNPQLILAPDDLDAGSVEFHTTPVFYHEGYYISPLQILDRAQNGGVVDIELAMSRDGYKWERPFRKLFWLQRTGGNKFDSGSLFVCAQPVTLGDETRFYYGAYSQGATGGDDYSLASGIGMATMTRDRFVGIEPVAVSDQPTLKAPLHNVGQVTLKAVDLGGVAGVELNADAKDGMIRVELLDEEGKRLRGFMADDAAAISGDSVRHRVMWKATKLLPPRKCLIRVHLDKATLYGVTLKEK